MNNELVDSTKFNYQVQMYLKMLLNSTQVARDTLLQASLFYKDQAGAFTLVSRANPELSSGNYKRAMAIRGGRVVELRGWVISDVLDTGKPLVDRVSLLLRFYPESYKKCLIATIPPPAQGQEPAPLPVYQIEIISAELSVRRIEPKQSRVQTAIYLYTKMRTQQHIFPRGLTEFGPVTLATRIMPKRAWVMIITEDSFTGKAMDHRLNFRNFGLNHISVSVNSETKPFKQGYNPDFPNNLYAEPYMALVHEAAKTMGNVDIPIRYGEYDTGFAIYPFDLSSNHSIKKMSMFAPERMMHASVPMNVCTDELEQKPWPRYSGDIIRHNIKSSPFPSEKSSKSCMKSSPFLRTMFGRKGGLFRRKGRTFQMKRENN